MVNFDYRLTDYDISVLRMYNGEPLPEGEVIPGAAVNVTSEQLRNWGYLTGMYNISMKGKDYLKEHRHRYKLATVLV